MDKNLNKDEHRHAIAKLESRIDHLETELTYLNGLLMNVGFPEGITTLKATAEELLAEGTFDFQQHHHKGL
ncbi:MAG: hypothetical protein AB7N99_03930 [Simkaniaceae bacterium]|jgi:hypothetical protein